MQNMTQDSVDSSRKAGCRHTVGFWEEMSILTEATLGTVPCSPRVLNKLSVRNRSTDSEQRHGYRTEVRELAF